MRNSWGGFFLVFLLFFLCFLHCVLFYPYFFLPSLDPPHVVARWPPISSEVLGPFFDHRPRTISEYVPTAAVPSLQTRLCKAGTINGPRLDMKRPPMISKRTRCVPPSEGTSHPCPNVRLLLPALPIPVPTVDERREKEAHIF